MQFGHSLLGPGLPSLPRHFSKPLNHLEFRSSPTSSRIQECCPKRPFLSQCPHCVTWHHFVSLISLKDPWPLCTYGLWEHCSGTGRNVSGVGEEERHIHTVASRVQYFRENRVTGVTANSLIAGLLLLYATDPA